MISCNTVAQQQCVLELFSIVTLFSHVFVRIKYVETQTYKKAACEFNDVIIKCIECNKSVPFPVCAKHNMIH